MIDNKTVEIASEKKIRGLFETYENKMSTKSRRVSKMEIRSIIIEIGVISNTGKLQKGQSRHTIETLGMKCPKGKTVSWLGHSFREKNSKLHPRRYNHNMCKCGEKFQMIFQYETHNLGGVEVDMVNFQKVNFEPKKRTTNGIEPVSSEVGKRISYFEGRNTKDGYFPPPSNSPPPTSYPMFTYDYNGNGVFSVENNKQYQNTGNLYYQKIRPKLVWPGKGPCSGSTQVLIFFSANYVINPFQCGVQIKFGKEFSLAAIHVYKSDHELIKGKKSIISLNDKTSFQHVKSFDDNEFTILCHSPPYEKEGKVDVVMDVNNSSEVMKNGFEYYGGKREEKKDDTGSSSISDDDSEFTDPYDDYGLFDSDDEFSLNNLVDDTELMADLPLFGMYYMLQMFFVCLFRKKKFELGTKNDATKIDEKYVKKVIACFKGKKDMLGFTLLHHFAAMKWNYFVDLLVKEGYDEELKDNFGMSAKEYLVVSPIMEWGEEKIDKFVEKIKDMVKTSKEIRMKIKESAKTGKEFISMPFTHEAMTGLNEKDKRLFAIHLLHLKRLAQKRVEYNDKKLDNFKIVLKKYVKKFKNFSKMGADDLAKIEELSSIFSNPVLLEDYLKKVTKGKSRFRLMLTKIKKFSPDYVVDRMKKFTSFLYAPYTDFGIVRVSIAINNVLLYWSNSSIVDIINVENQKSFILLDLPQLDVDDMKVDFGKLSKQIVGWNVKKTYLGIGRNCQDFVRSILTEFGINTGMIFGMRIQNYLEKVKKTDVTKVGEMELIVDKDFAKKFMVKKMMKKKGRKYTIKFTSHKQLDDFCYHLLYENALDLKFFNKFQLLGDDYRDIFYLLKGYDRSFWLRHFSDEKNEMYKPSEEHKIFGEGVYRGSCPFQHPHSTGSF